DSTMDMWTTQPLPDRGDFEDWVIDNFVRMYRNYFAFLQTAPEGCIYEIRFEDFEKDPFPYLKEAYEKLDLGDYEAAKAGFEEYWQQEADYKKNTFEYPEHLKKKIEDKLGFYFEHYGYRISEIQ
ncbi:MAG: sulfotransferase, partial [Clostridia bacterium]|nr:sulfotransferase [Clostridia bacterium]